MKVKKTGNIYEISTAVFSSFGSATIKINKDEYIDVKTGEVKSFNHHDKRIEDIKEVARSIARGRDLINANCDNPARIRWITLTYAENMTDPVRLYKDFERFVKRCRRRWGHFEYITCAEPQRRGAWHLHCIFIFDGEAPFMANNEVADKWGQGFVSVKAVDNCDNLGAYLSAYLGNAVIDYREGDEHCYQIIELDGQKKSVIKGARMHYYPAQFHIFRHSKGIKEPEISYTSYEQAKKMVCSAKQTFTKETVIDTDDFSTVIQYEYYNTVR